ncbi:MAG: hypothetical protein ACLFU0_09885, partial [Alphaproteobacteria bacterium]
PCSAARRSPTRPNSRSWLGVSPSPATRRCARAVVVQLRVSTLTGVANRRGWLAGALRHPHRDRHGARLFVALDHVKAVDDGSGHAN